MTDFGQMKRWGERLAKPASLPTHITSFYCHSEPACSRQAGSESLLITTLARSG